MMKEVNDSIRGYIKQHGREIRLLEWAAAIQVILIIGVMGWLIWSLKG